MIINDLMMDGLPLLPEQDPYRFVTHNGHLIPSFSRGVPLQSTWYNSNRNYLLPFVTQSRLLTAFKKKHFEIIEGRGENAGNQRFLLFPQCFIRFLNKISLFFSAAFTFSSTIAFNFDQSKILSVGKELKRGLRKKRYRNMNIGTLFVASMKKNNENQHHVKSLLFLLSLSFSSMFIEE